MLIKDIVRELDGVGCDGVKIGDPNKEVTKIAVTMWATPRVIQRAAELGANLIITHEPTFYTDADAARDNPVDKLKLELIKKADVVICRYHTKMHRITPDLSPTGALYYLGLGGKLEPTEYFGSSIFTSDEPISANEMAVLIRERLGVKHIRIAGNGD